MLAFVAIESRVAHPLLPLRVPADRDRGASFLSVGLASAAMFGVFLFLTYYLQQNLHYSPIRNGFAFMPLTATIMLSAIIAQTRLAPKFGPRPLVSTGMALGAAGMLLLSGLGIHSTYVSGVLPALLVMGVGFGLIMAPSMNSATFGVRASDAGVASATVSASQQIGGSIGTALLSTIATSAATGSLAGARPTSALIATATVHGYTTAFAFSAGIFALGALLAALLFRTGPQLGEAQSAEPLAEVVAEPVIAF